MKVKLKELGTISTGNTPSKNISEFYDSEDIGFVKPDIISDLQIEYIVNTSEYLSEAARTKARIVKKDAVFVTCIGSIGKVGIAKGSEFAFNQQINAIEPNEKILSKYLAYSIWANKKKLQAIANAPVVPIINKTQFGEFEIDITDDVDEQGKIVELLDKVCTIIADRKSELEKLDELIKARFVELFGLPLVNDKGWNIKLAGEICSITDGSHFSPEGIEEGYPMLSVRNMRNDGFHYDDCKKVSRNDYEILVKQGCKPLKNDVLIAKDGSYFYYGFVVNKEIEQAILSSIAILRPNMEQVLPEYLCKYMLSKEIVELVGRNYVTGAAIKRVILKGIKQIPVMLPPLEEQKNFVRFVKQVDKSKIVVQKALDEAQLLFDSLMQKYFG